MWAQPSISIMMCESASGILLSPYVIYKAQKMWAQWTENSPKGDPCCSDRCCMGGSRYNRTNHGWFDGQTFTDWFCSSFLPHAKKLPGRKILLGDNLSSHFTDTVIQLILQTL
ncbi:DDE superfamily endonuclease [Popillia japonica]|uniref:DDE superfamily endonuclease n=1 Tax=Popillia japonica TaxID=7064 RepID=A0AAW1L7Q2_POPJA